MKKDYMTRLERAARWRLPPQEAEDVIADYREMVGDPPRSEEELIRDLGKPRDAVRPLTRKWPYRIWLAVFAFLSLCILSLGLSGTGFSWRIWRLYFEGYLDGTKNCISYVVVITGAVVALMWFHQQGRKAARLPRAIPILLAVLLAWCGGVLLYCWMFARDFDGSLLIWGTMPTLIGPNAGEPMSVSLFLPLDIMLYGSALLSLTGVFWLVKARTRDRRWAAVYILALAAMLAALNIVALTHSMNPIPAETPEEVFRQLLLENAGITAVGLLGAGVALC